MNVIFTQNSRAWGHMAHRFVVSLLASAGLLATAAMAAPPVENTGCILDQPTAPSGLNCTANDIQLSSPAITVIDPCSFSGDTAKLQVLVDITGTAQTRYDIGVWLSVDGDPNGDGSESGTCSVVSIPNNILDVDGNSTNIDADACGDVANTAAGPPDILQADMGTVDVLCLDSNSDGLIDVPVIVSWKQQSANDCSTSAEALPGTSAKCDASLAFSLDVPIPGRIIVNKTTAPQPDATSFGFTLAGPVSGIPGGFDGSEGFSLPHGGQFDSGTTVLFEGGLPAGDNYSVSETADALYDSIGVCVSDLGPGNTDPANIDLNSGETVTCTFTNTLKASQAGIFTVHKDFSDNSAASVLMTLTCTTGTIVDNTLDATETVPAVFTINGFDPGATCTATEAATPGYTQDNSDCQAAGHLADGGSCTMVNTVNTGSFTVFKDYNDATQTPVTVTASCTGGGTFTSNPLPAAPGAPAIFTYNGFTGNPTCTAVESAVPAGFTSNNADCQDNDPLGGSCVIVNSAIPPSVSASRATFTVNKTFTDGNTETAVTYNISCNTGVPLIQQQTAPAGIFAVEFVVEAFDQGELNCRVWESAVAGYSGVYAATSEFADASAVNSGEADTEGCFFDNVNSSDYESGPMNVCAIENSPDPVTISVTKDWVIDGSGGDVLNSDYNLTLLCGDDEFIDEVDATGTTDQTFDFEVVPDWDGGTDCTVDEDVFDDSVEVDNGCSALHVDIGEGDSCTITNTVFFEGIPTLSQYGLAMLALLMLGVGFVGFRRFV
jgi:hypothetical protein